MKYRLNFIILEALGEEKTTDHLRLCKGSCATVYVLQQTILNVWCAMSTNCMEHASTQPTIVRCKLQICHTLSDCAYIYEYLSCTLRKRVHKHCMILTDNGHEKKGAQTLYDFDWQWSCTLGLQYIWNRGKLKEYVQMLMYPVQNTSFNSSYLFLCGLAEVDGLCLNLWNAGVWCQPPCMEHITTGSTKTQPWYKFKTQKRKPRGCGRYPLTVIR